MSFLIIDDALTTRIQDALTNALASRFENVARLDGNALGLQVRVFKNATAYIYRGEPRILPNLVFGLTPADIDILDEIFAWFRAANLKFVLEILPARSSDVLLRTLVEGGMYQSGFKNEYYGVPTRDVPKFAEGVTVRVFEDDALDEFAELALTIDETPANERARLKEIRRAEFVNWRGYVAYVDGQPAAHAALYIRDGTGSFGFMETNAKFRGRGAQTALLNQRIADCAQARSEFVFCQAVPGTISARNVERAGFRVAYTKAAWSFL